MELDRLDKRPQSRHNFLYIYAVWIFFSSIFYHKIGLGTDFRPTPTKAYDRYGGQQIWRGNPTPMRPIPNNYRGGQPGRSGMDRRIHQYQHPSFEPVPAPCEFERFPDEVNEKLLAELREYFKNKPSENEDNEK